MHEVHHWSVLVKVVVGCLENRDLCTQTCHFKILSCVFAAFWRIL